MAVYVIATLDTKGEEADYATKLLIQSGWQVLLIDAGSKTPPVVTPHISREEVFAAAGTSWHEVLERGDRGWAVSQAAQGVKQLLLTALAKGELDGVLGLGGSAGTTIATEGMRSLPLGIPKVMISTLASGNTRSFIRGRDIVMVPSIVDLAGLNRITRLMITQGVSALDGMLRQARQEKARQVGPITQQTERRLIVASMFGVTTPCVQQARRELEAAGYEVLVFHATGTGGEAMEGLIEVGEVAGVLDITTTELADELAGGVLSAGPSRLTAAARLGIPQVVSVGALDMVNFGPPETIPERYRHRQFYQHNPHVTLMRTTAQECRQLGEEIGRKLSLSRGATCVFFPLRGISALDQEGQPFFDPQARHALLEGIRATLHGVELHVIDAHINDPQFATACVERLLQLMQ